MENLKMEELEKKLNERNDKQIKKELKNAKVAIAGVGGLGSNIAVSLARAGVGNLLLVDFDNVEPSNLNRQFYTLKHLGMKKTEALKTQLLDINPFIQVETKEVYITEENVFELFKDYDIVCEAFDKAENKAMLINTLLSCLPNVKIVSGSGMAGYRSSNSIKTQRRMKNLYVCGDGVLSDISVMMSARVMICAGHQANMVIRLLAGINEE